MVSKEKLGSFARSSLICLMWCFSIVSWLYIFGIYDPAEIDVEPKFTHTEIAPYLNKFKEHCKLYKKDCSKLETFGISIGKIPWLINYKGTTIGVCSYSKNVVLIEESYWNEATYAEKEVLVFHEAAHCVLEKDHVQGQGDHIMNPIAIFSGTYTMYYQELQDKLFDCSKNCPKVEWNRERDIQRISKGM